MKTENKTHLSKNEIAFRNFSVSRDLRKVANLRFLELLTMAPPGADGGGLVDKSTGATSEAGQAKARRGNWRHGERSAEAIGLAREARSLIHEFRKLSEAI